MQLFAVCFHDPISTVEAHNFDMGPTPLKNDVLQTGYSRVLLYNNLI